MKSKILTLVFIFATLLSMAQGQTIEMADGLRASGKIYVVVSVLITIFTGITIYLINIDRKLSRLEKEINRSNQEK